MSDETTNEFKDGTPVLPEEVTAGFSAPAAEMTPAAIMTDGSIATVSEDGTIEVDGTEAPGANQEAAN